MAGLLNTTLVITFVSIFLMGAYLGQSLYQQENNGSYTHAQVEQGYKNLYWNATELQESHTQPISNTSGIMGEEISNLVNAMVDFYGRAAFSIGRLGASYGYNHPDINYNAAFYSIFSIIIIILIIQNIETIIIPIALAYLSIKYVYGKIRNRKT